MSQKVRNPSFWLLLWAIVLTINFNFLNKVSQQVCVWRFTSNLSGPWNNPTAWQLSNQKQVLNPKLQLMHDPRLLRLTFWVHLTLIKKLDHSGTRFFQRHTTHILLILDTRNRIFTGMKAPPIFSHNCFSQKFLKDYPLHMYCDLHKLSTVCLQKYSCAHTVPY